MISEWSHIEHKLALLLSVELGAKWKAMRPMLYAIESSSARLEVIRAAFITLLADDAPRREAMQSILTRARALLTQRNKYAHALYGFSREGGIAIASINKGTANDLPLHDLTHQFGEMKELSHKVGQMLGFPTPHELRAKLLGIAVPRNAAPDLGDPPTRA